MSAWKECKMELTCSLDVLKRAVSNLMPQWASHIRVDPSGKLDMYRWSGSREKRKDVTVNLLIPGSGNPNYPTPPGRGSDNDWGFAKGPDGKWIALFADYNHDMATKLAHSVKADVSRMKTLIAGKQRGYQATQKSATPAFGTGGKVEVDMVVDEDQARNILHMVKE